MAPKDIRTDVFNCLYVDVGYCEYQDETGKRRKIGLHGMAVFGCIWRYSHLKDGYCHAALKKIAAECLLSERTTRSYLRILERAGLIEAILPAIPRDHVPTGYVCRYVPEAERKRID